MNTGHPLVPYACWLLNDLLNGRELRSGISSSASFLTPVVATDGIALQTVAGGSGSCLVSNGFLDNSGASGTVVWRINPATAFNDGLQNFQWGQTSTGMEFSATKYSDGNWYVGWGSGGGRLTLAASATNYTQGVYQTYAFCWNSGGMFFYRNGVLLTQGSAPTTSPSTSPFVLLNYQSGPTSMSGSMAFLYLYRSCLSQMQVLQLSIDPYCFMQPQSPQDRYWANLGTLYQQYLFAHLNDFNMQRLA